MGRRPLPGHLFTRALDENLLSVPLILQVQDRVDFIETTPNVSKLAHLRIVAFMAFLLVRAGRTVLRSPPCVCSPWLRHMPHPTPHYMPVLPPTPDSAPTFLAPAPGPLCPILPAGRRLPFFAVHAVPHAGQGRVGAPALCL